MIKTVEMEFEYAPTLAHFPVPTKQLKQMASSNDDVTMDHWREIWFSQFKANQEKHGPFNDKSIGKLFNKHQYKPCIVAGAGPSLKNNGLQLKDRGGIPLISCLHNFHYFEDNDIDVDYYVSLDAGEITVKEVSEGGKLTEDEYWARTKNRTLLAYTATHPKLLEKWQGEIYFFSVPSPDPELQKRMNDIEPFHAWISVGGNVLGACAYIARFFGCTPTVFVGASFSFSYDNKFHPWDSEYDKKIGQCVKAIDVYGHAVKTWQSYYNFKAYFDWMTSVVPGIYINCSEGGIMGAYSDGIIPTIKTMDLKDFLLMYNMNKLIEEQFKDTTKPNHIVLY